MKEDGARKKRNITVTTMFQNKRMKDSSNRFLSRPKFFLRSQIFCFVLFFVFCFCFLFPEGAFFSVKWGMLRMVWNVCCVWVFEQAVVLGSAA